MAKWLSFRRHSVLDKILANEKIDPKRVLKIERSEFGGEGKDPSETLDGILFLMSHGMILKPENIDAYAESIKLEDLLLYANALPPESPLRMVVENDKHNRLLRSVRDKYPGRGAYHYSHGVVVLQKGQGYGKALFRERLKMLVGENDLMFGFIMAYPPNVPAIRMALNRRRLSSDGAVIDKVEDHVYEHGVRYFRWVYDRKITYGPRIGTISLDDASRIAHQLNAGFLGTSFEDGSIVFNRRF